MMLRGWPQQHHRGRVTRLRRGLFTGEDVQGPLAELRPEATDVLRAALTRRSPMLPLGADESGYA